MVRPVPSLGTPDSGADAILTGKVACWRRACQPTGSAR